MSRSVESREEVSRKAVMKSWVSLKMAAAQI